ncbi:MAG: uroporphyrinogen-III C-methyltransferase [Planctomycetaceae bacterium]
MNRPAEKAGHPGTVSLVGAGPGDPGLLTVKGLSRLQRADLVLYDGLVNPLLLRHTGATCERTSRSDTSSGRRLQQDEINRRLIDAAKQGRTVVRLKGGDPFIFGRGGEEAAALREAGVPFEVVPGVTAATAAGAYAGITLTHREFASQVTFVTGHEDPGKQHPAVDYRLLAELRGTLVFYMGLHRLEAIAESLIAHGKPADTPCCVISRATTPGQQIVDAPLAGVAAASRAADLHAPSLFVVGEAVNRRAALSWFERLPLIGKRIGITRPAQQADSAVARCLELGADPVLMPTIEIAPPDDWSDVDAVLKRLGEFDWLVFTSANGVEFLLDRLWETGGDARQLGSANIACIGPATANRLERYHLRADVIPDEFRAEALADALRPHVAGRRVLWARASRGRDVLPEALTAAGAKFEQVVVYRNGDVDALPLEQRRQIERGELDWIGLSSPSIARSLNRLLGDSALDASVRFASISPVTSAAAREAELPVCAEATDYTWDGLIAAIVREESETG